MAKEIILYVVTAFRWGDRKDHHYLCGVFTKKHAAQKCADDERDYRGGKYAGVVEKITLDHYSKEDLGNSKEIYRAKSVRD